MISLIVRENITIAIPYTNPKILPFRIGFLFLQNIILRRKIDTSEDTRNQNLVTNIVLFLTIANWLNPPLKERGFVV
jgi:hypothetical protein